MDNKCSLFKSSPQSICWRCIPDTRQSQKITMSMLYSGEVLIKHLHLTRYKSRRSQQQKHLICIGYFDNKQLNIKTHCTSLYPQIMVQTLITSQVIIAADKYYATKLKPRRDKSANWVRIHQKKYLEDTWLIDFQKQMTCTRIKIFTLQPLLLLHPNHTYLVRVPKLLKRAWTDKGDNSCSHISGSKKKWFFITLLYMG